MRRVDDLPPSRQSRFGGRSRVFFAILIAAFVVFALSLRGIAGFYTDYLWFDSLDRTDVFTSVLGAKIALTLIFAGTFFVFMFGNLFIADRGAPELRTPGPEEEMLARYHEVTAGRTGLVRAGISVLFALIASAGVGSRWEEWLLFVNRQDFGVNDPQFNQDIGFYVFQLPFLSFVVDWAFAAIVIVFILTAIAHYLNGGIRLAVIGTDRVTSHVKVHLSAILAVLALVKAADYWLSRYELTVSTRGVVDGALYTDINAQLPATSLLIAISLCAVVLLVINLRLRGWVMPILAVGLWSFTAIVMGGIYPAFVQRFQVEPNETTRETEFTERNISATRDAFGLEPGVDLTEASYDYSEDLTEAEIREHADTVRNARILDPLVSHPTFERFQAEREFYGFNGSLAFVEQRAGQSDFDPTLDTDRYLIEGEVTQVVLGVRELKLTDLSWEREHVRLTHGYGIALAQANATTVEGRPNFLVGNLPLATDPSIDLNLETPQVYHGEGLDGYALVGTSVDEIDYVDSVTSENVLTRYEGESGVELGSLFRRAAFAMRFGQIEPLISNFVTDETRVIYNRDVHGRVEELAPFLEFDADAYPVVVEGRIHYVIDAFTTSDRFPYSQRADASGMVQGDLNGARFNYVRNSVKAVVDAYDGDVTFYVMPVDDPIIDAWRSAFPDLFTEFDEMPDELRDNLRYPQDLFRIQTNMWARYQVDDPVSLIVGSEDWAVAQNPGRQVIAGSTSELITDEDTGLSTSRERRVDPYYTLLELPGENELSFVTLRSFVPFDENDNRRELEAFMVGETRPDGTSRLVSYEITSADAPGPVLIASAIAQNEEISSRLTLLDDSGSQVEFGDLVLLPIADSILWVRPLYVAAEGTSSVPTLEAVIITVGESGRIAIGETLGDALSQMFDEADFTDILGATPTAVEDVDDVESDEPDTDETPDDVGPVTPEAILAEVARLFAARDAALAEDPPNRVEAATLEDLIAALLAEVDLTPAAESDAVDPGEVDA